MNKKCILLLSGGMDSVSLFYFLKKEGYEVFPVFFDYGQRHIKELDYAKKHVNPKVLAIPSASIKSSLVSENIDNSVPENTVVPLRNMVMLTHSAQYAVEVDVNEIFIGVNSGDFNTYLDCRSEFILSIEKCLFFCGYNISIKTPFINMTKSDIVSLMHQLGVKPDETWTCYSGGAEPCHKCSACESRMEALANA